MTIVEEIYNCPSCGNLGTGGLCKRCSSDSEGIIEPKNKTEVKQDQGKMRYDLMPFDALDEVALILTYGVTKYPNPEENWRENSTFEDIARYKAALLRHYSAMAQGEIYDMGTPELPGTGRPHMACVATNSLFILALEKKYGVYNGIK